MTNGGAWVCLGWGVLATSMGLFVAADYRGLTGSIIAERARNAEALRRAPFLRRTVTRPAAVPTQRRVVRLLGGFFGVAGVIAAVIGIVALTRRGWPTPAIDLHPHLTVVGVVGGCGIVALGAWLWRPEGGLIRRGWDGGGLGRAAAVGTTLALLVALGGWVPMVPPLFVAGLVLAAPGVIILSVRRADHPGRTAGL